MENKYCIIDFITSGNTLPTACDEILLAKCFIVDNFGNQVGNGADLIIQNEYPISISEQLYFGLDEQYIKANGIQKQIGLVKLVQILTALAKKDIPIIGWNASEHVLDMLEHNVQAFKINIDTSFMKQHLHIIDLMVCSSLIADAGLLNGSFSTLENISYFFHKKNNDMSLSEFQNNIRNSRMDQTKCINETCSLMVHCLKNIMAYTESKTISELEEKSKEPHIVKFMPFGKYKNKLLEEIAKSDGRYLLWAMNEQSIAQKNPNLKYTIAKLLNIQQG